MALAISNCKVTEAVMFQLASSFLSGNEDHSYAGMSTDAILPGWISCTRLEVLSWTRRPGPDTNSGPAGLLAEPELGESGLFWDREKAFHCFMHGLPELHVVLER